MVVFDWKVREVWEVKEVFGVTGGLENCFAIDELWDHIQLRLNSGLSRKKQWLFAGK